MRIIKISRCLDCPHCQEFDEEDYCRAKAIERWSIDSDTIPNWCPLEKEQSKPRVNREFVEKWAERIYCDRKSLRATKRNLSDFSEEAGVEVNDE